MSDGRRSPARPLVPVAVASTCGAVRGFGVMLASPLALLAGAAWSVRTTARAVRRRQRPPMRALAGTAAVAAYALAIRPRMLRWGATDPELRRELPGDEPPGEPGPTWAVTVNAPASRTWPWLAQIGQDRGGFYSYEWLENLAGCRMRNADRINPEWQHREVGEKVYLHPDVGLEVKLFEPGRALVLDGWGAFVVDPIDERSCRLIGRGHYQPGAPGRAYAALLEIPHFIMERRMLLGIKERAERDV